MANHVHRADQVRPLCPFCAAPWSDAMLDQYDAMTDENACACCAGPALAHHGHVERKAAMPASDLCCGTCGKAIYEAPGLG